MEELLKHCTSGIQTSFDDLVLRFTLETIEQNVKLLKSKMLSTARDKTNSLEESNQSTSQLTNTAKDETKSVKDAETQSDQEESFSKTLRDIVSQLSAKIQSAKEDKSESTHESNPTIKEEVELNSKVPAALDTNNQNTFEDVTIKEEIESIEDFEVESDEKLASSFEPAIIKKELLQVQSTSQNQAQTYTSFSSSSSNNNQEQSFQAHIVQFRSNSTTSQTQNCTTSVQETSVSIVKRPYPAPRPNFPFYRQPHRNIIINMFKSHQYHGPYPPRFNYWQRVPKSWLNKLKLYVERTVQNKDRILDNYLALLEDPCQQLIAYTYLEKLPSPSYDINYGYQECIYASVLIGNREFRSYPRRAYTNRQATRLAAISAVKIISYEESRCNFIEDSF